MTEGKPTAFLSGVIEGFYGKPWSSAERSELFESMSDWGLNTYLYAPKDDLKHRALWREPYNATEGAELNKIIDACRERGLNFFYGLSPGLDISYSNPSDLQALKDRFKQLLAWGCKNFALLFDDIPDRIHPADLEQWGSLAGAQAVLVNEMFRWVRQSDSGVRFLFCPTPYCGRMSDRQLGGGNYLISLGRELLPEIEVFWTGPEIISREITVTQLAELGAVLRRKPLIWDNLHANDYDGRRFFCGPYSGRSPEVRRHVSGVLLNPNTEFPLNFVPLRTFAAWLNGAASWDPRTAYREAMQSWLPKFELVKNTISLEDLILFGDCYYLPDQLGNEAEDFYQSLDGLLKRPPSKWMDEVGPVREKLGSLKQFCIQLVELRDRPLFHALSRRVWELREELDLIDGFLAFKSEPKNRDLPFYSDFHLPQTYRGGLVPQLQRLLAQKSDGSFVPGSHE